MMKLVRLPLLAGMLTAAFTGCTYTNPGPEQETRQVESPATSRSAPTASVILEGNFQSQAAATTGTATLEVSDSGAVLRLENMATDPGKDLRVMLSPGTLTPGAGGEATLSSSRMVEIGPFRAAATHRFVMDSQMWDAMQEPVRSVLIYDYATKTTYGTANLSDVSSSPPVTSVDKG